MARESRDDGLLQTVLIQARQDGLSAADTAAPPPPLELPGRGRRPQHDRAEKSCDVTTAMARPSSTASSAAFNSNPHPPFLEPESAATGPASLKPHAKMWDRVLHPMVRRLVWRGTSGGNPAFYTGTFQSQVCGISVE